MSASELPLPSATVVHQAPGRVRIRIPARRGDRDFFAKTAEALAGDLKAEVDANPATAGILIRAAGLSARQVADAGSASLFQLENPPQRRPSAADIVAAPVAGADRTLAAVTGGALDLPNAVFLLLVGFGIYEIVRGNFKSPPWYTAFWYAFGVFTKSLLDRQTS